MRKVVYLLAVLAFGCEKPEYGCGDNNFSGKPLNPVRTRTDPNATPTEEPPGATFVPNPDPEEPAAQPCPKTTTTSNDISQ